MSKSVSKSTKSVKPEEVKVEQPLVEEVKSSKKVAAPSKKEEAKPAKKEEAKPAVAPVVEEAKPAKKSAKKEEAAKPAAPAVEEAKPAKKSVKKEEAAKPAAPAAPAAEESHEESKQRREVTRESVDAEFDSIIETLTTRMELVSAEEKKSGIAKLLRTLQKRVKVLKGDVARISKQRVRGTRQSNTSSGFMKPVKISGDMAGFTGWNSDELRSRVEVTKYICNYIKDHNLQNPEDRRQIIPDAKLSKLLGYDKKKEDKPLTYYYLQQKIQPHFQQVA